MSLNPLTYQPHSNLQLLEFNCVFELLVCDRSASVNVITNTFVGLKCLTEIKIQILYDHVDHTRFHIVEMGCQMFKLVSAYIVGPTMFINLTPALELHENRQIKSDRWHFISQLHQEPVSSTYSYAVSEWSFSGL